MKVRSTLANMDIVIGKVRREGNGLALIAGPGSAVETTIVMSAGEVLCTLGKVLSTPSSLLFVLALPYFWLRQKFAPAGGEHTASGSATRASDINKPW